MSPGSSRQLHVYGGHARSMPTCRCQEDGSHGAGCLLAGLLGASAEVQTRATSCSQEKFEGSALGFDLAEGLPLAQGANSGWSDSPLLACKTGRNWACNKG